MTESMFADPSWEQAALLMQPALIRLIDQLRHQLEQSDWRGEYETVEIWPEGVPEAIKAQVMELHQQLDQANEAERIDLEASLAELPQPMPLYLLHLTKAEQHSTFNLWELCYQICLIDYQPVLDREAIADLPIEQIHIDTDLIDETGEVKWHDLDEKAARVVTQAFAQLK